MPGLVSNLLRPFRFGYDAVESDDKKRRRPARSIITSEDRTLDSTKRKKLIATNQDLVRNYSVASWAVRKHLDYVASFSFQSRTGDKELDQRIEELIEWASGARNFDAAGRHSRARFVRIAEARRTLDGDFFTLKLSSGLIQGIEGDRIRTPTGRDLPIEWDADRVIHGVKTSKAGRAQTYCLHNRKPRGDGYTFARLVPSRHVIAHGYYDRIDQIRGIAPIASGINALQDTYEGIDYALAKAKVSQLFALKFKREGDEALGDVTDATDEDGNEDKSERKLDFGTGPISLDLDPGEDADFLESKTPPQEFQAFLQSVIMIALKAIDLPYCFFDEAHTNWAGNRQAWLLYDQGAQNKRQDNRDLLDAWTAWRIALLILDGTLELPAGFSPLDLKWEWVARGIPWIDPLKEISADITAIEAKLTSRQRVCKRGGVDFFDIVDELATEEAYIGEQLGSQTPSAVDSELRQAIRKHLIEEALADADA